MVKCKYCNKGIKKGTKVAGLYTYNDFPKVSDETYFHFNCFLKWLNTSIENKAKKIYSQTMTKIIPQARGMIDKILNNNEEETNKSYI